jgi:hypothetical protein
VIGEAAYESRDEYSSQAAAQHRPAEANEEEGFFGSGKRRYSLDLIMAE